MRRNNAALAPMTLRNTFTRSNYIFLLSAPHILSRITKKCIEKNFSCLDRSSFLLYVCNYNLISAKKTQFGKPSIFTALKFLSVKNFLEKSFFCSAGPPPCFPFSLRSLEINTYLSFFLKCIYCNRPFLWVGGGGGGRQ